MKICLIGKFPPIEGGVSTRTYWTAHGLARRGHEVHVVTNAKEVLPPFRMHMRAEDWQRCEAVYGAGSVKLHWTDPVDRSQFYIPMASAFVSKLAAIAARAHSQHRFDVILSHYMEPYGIAGELAARMTGMPHVVRMAGSDAGRLWRHPQFEVLYDHVLRSAEIVVATGAVAERAIGRGVDPARLALGGGFVVPEGVFTPFGATLDLPLLLAEIEQDPILRSQVWGGLSPDLPYFGVYGKLGDSKGSFALLAALHRLKQRGIEVGLLALAHGRPVVERRFRVMTRKLDLFDRVLQLPFLPNWRVPEFLRGCIAVCALEQDFPIVFHSPIVAREVLLCGACLVGSTEMIRKLPAYERLPDGYGCVAVADVRDIEALSERLAAIVQDREPLASVGARGCAFARWLQEGVSFPDALERALETAAARQGGVSAVLDRRASTRSDPLAKRFVLTRLAGIAIDDQTAGAEIDLAAARRVLIALESRVERGEAEFAPTAIAVRIEISIAAAEQSADDRSVGDSLFRLRRRRWATTEADFGELIPQRAPNLRVVAFDFDVAPFLGARTLGQLPAQLTGGPSYVAVFARSTRDREPLLVDGSTALILQLSDGTRTVSQIANELIFGAEGAGSANDYVKWIETLFLSDLLWLSDQAESAAEGLLLPGRSRNAKEAAG